jgi:hypothetical protein
MRNPPRPRPFQPFPVHHVLPLPPDKADSLHADQVFTFLLLQHTFLNRPAAAPVRPQIFTLAIEFAGNFLLLEPEVHEGVPAIAQLKAFLQHRCRKAVLMDPGPADRFAR